MRLIAPEDLKPKKGIPFSRAHLHRLIKAGKFPRPVKLGDNRNAFVEIEVDQYLANRIARRLAEQFLDEDASERGDACPWFRRQFSDLDLEPSLRPVALAVFLDHVRELEPTPGRGGQANG
jgi:prophage regulatory protein